MLFVVTLSLGESVWSPRWYDYSMSLAPEGREGIFTALASAPLFAAKLPTGALLHGAHMHAACSRACCPLALPPAHACRCTPAMPWCLRGGWRRRNARLVA